ncbi:MAG: MarR family winged helix-turn-helix transcriptional regulator [Thermoplasmatales archaeon]|nr:MarR family winged helix-turn-helix transcriptional regulator [Thermoplasmatales archaeon]
MIPQITLKEKIILHLFFYKDDALFTPAPYQMTQQGIAEALDADRAHVSVSLNELIKKGYVEKRTGHVKKLMRRRNIYFLTHDGINHAQMLKDRFEALVVHTEKGEMKLKNVEETIKGNLIDALKYIRTDEKKLPEIKIAIHGKKTFYGATVFLFGYIVFLSSFAYIFLNNNLSLSFFSGIISVFVMGIGLKQLWSDEVIRRKVSIFISANLAFILLLIVHTVFETEYLLDDVLTSFGVIGTVFAVSIFGYFIPLKVRCEMLRTVGSTLVSVSILSIIIGSNVLGFSSFWVLSGVLCLVVDNEMREKNNDSKDFNLGAGVSVIGCIFLIIYTITPNISAWNILLLTGWFCLGLFIIGGRFTNLNENIMKTLRSSAPMGIGIIFVFFSIILAANNRYMSSVIEACLGITVGIYGLKGILKMDKGMVLLSLYFLFLIFFTLISVVYRL